MIKPPAGNNDLRNSELLTHKVIYVQTLQIEIAVTVKSSVVLRSIFQSFIILGFIFITSN